MTLEEAEDADLDIEDYVDEKPYTDLYKEWSYKCLKHWQYN